MSGSNPIPHVDQNLDVTKCTEGVWLVKVPKYIANRWEKAPGGGEVGKLKIDRSNKQDIKVSMILSDEVLRLKEPSEQPIPKEHKMSITGVTRQSLGVFSHMPQNNTKGKGKEKLSMEGRILQKVDCTPYDNTCYMNLKLDTIRKAYQPVRQTMKLNHVVQNFKPISNHKTNIENDERKKTEGKKAREDKEVVLEMLFGAFEKHQYYNIKDLVKVTRQPITYLKEIVKEVCNYNMRNPHRNMWELKPEYRYYNQKDDDDKKAAQNSDSDSD